MNYREKVEKHIGRKLRSDEDIHHKDGDQHNNKLSNLQIVKAGSEHRKLDAKVDVNWKKKLNDISKDLIIQPVKITDSLDLFFTARQQYILYRKLKKLKLSKTEQEYYSRAIKPKIKAIANPELYKISQTLAWQLS